MSCVPSPIVSRPRISMNHIFAEEKARGREALSNAMMEYILDMDTGSKGNLSIDAGRFRLHRRDDVEKPQG